MTTAILTAALIVAAIIIFYIGALAGGYAVGRRVSDAIEKTLDETEMSSIDKINFMHKFAEVIKP